MISVKHIEKRINGHYRCIVISDIHSHLDRFKQLLKKVDYTKDDYLVILGDFVEKGTQALETVQYLQQLQQQSDRVYVILGNCEYALESLVCNKKYAQHMTQYLRQIGKSGLISQAIAKLAIDKKTLTPEQLQEKVKKYLIPNFDYLRSLPTTLQLNNFIFVHAGLENRLDWQNSRLSSLIETKTFFQDGHCLNEYVIVGHIPTSNQFDHIINNNIIIDDEKRIICIDGGTGVKSISQLNALIITGNENEYSFSSNYVQPLPYYRAVVDVQAEKKQNYKIAWPNFEVDLLKKGKHFSLCKQNNTDNIFKIKNEFLYLRNQKLYCLDDYIDHFITLKKNEIVKLVGLYGPYAYVVKENEVGWIKYRYLQKCE